LKVWIDIVNAPHVRFFKSIIQYLEREGEEVLITARKFGDVHRLLDLFEIEYTLVGKHGATLEDKLLRSTSRVFELSKLIAREKPDVAVSKHSIELPRISFGLGIPSIYVLDNEHALAANKLTLPLCNQIIIPEAIDVWRVLECGADPNSLVRFKGTCELNHLQDFHYNPQIFQELNLDLKKDKTILMRPEPALASYLQTDCHKSVLSPIVEALADQANMLVIPRFREQEKIFEDDGKVIIVHPPVDTFSLMKACNLVIGAGGTMNREAALLGTPVISCYPGKLLAVDDYYIKKGLMKRSTSLDEIVDMSLGLIWGDGKQQKIENDDLFQIILDKIYQTAGNNGN
jgi:predicted glycosyltransferase